MSRFLPATVTAISFCRFLGFALVDDFAVNALRSASEIIEMLS